MLNELRFGFFVFLFFCFVFFSFNIEKNCKSGRIGKDSLQDNATWEMFEVRPCVFCVFLCVLVCGRNVHKQM